MRATLGPLIRLTLLLALLTAVPLSDGVAQTGNTPAAERRVALVVGNSRYQHAPTLPTLALDAEAIGAALRQVGFGRVDVAVDRDRTRFMQAIRDFEEHAVGADLALVYFGGYGFQLSGVNYLIPIDAVLARERDVIDETIALSRVFVSVSQARQ